MKLGFFDSGLGGLHIMQAVQKVLHEYEYVYYGDTAHLPYGDKTEEEIFRLTKIGMERLFDEDVLLAVVACNTASAATVRKLQDEFLLKNYPDRKILGVIIPTIEEVIEANVHEVLLIGTSRTITSGKYQKELNKHTVHQITLTSLATPQLVPLIEAEKLDEAFESVASEIKTHIESGGDGVILGCTHYDLIKERIQSLGDVKIFSQDEIIPSKLKEYLDKHLEIGSKLTKTSTKNTEAKIIKTQ